MSVQENHISECIFAAFELGRDVANLESQRDKLFCDGPLNLYELVEREVKALRGKLADIQTKAIAPVGLRIDGEGR
jgi:hypothetical protein